MEPETGNLTETSKYNTIPPPLESTGKSEVLNLQLRVHKTCLTQQNQGSQSAQSQTGQWHLEG